MDRGFSADGIWPIAPLLLIISTDFSVTGTLAFRIEYSNFYGGVQNYSLEKPSTFD